MTNESILCPNCSSKNDSEAKFCIECGYQLNSDSDVNENVNTVTQINSNVGTRDTVKKCYFCGSQISSSSAKCKFCGEWLDPSKDTEKFKIPIIFGYFFIPFFPLGALVIAIYLLTRDNESAKTNGKLMLIPIILFVILFVILLIIWFLIMASVSSSYYY